jgi:putative motility protein YjfB-like
MDGMSGSTNSLINLGMAMSDIRLKSAMSISTFKKGLEAQAQNAMSLIESVPVPSPQAQPAQTGQQIDLVA